jgi:hypothetical protein
MKSIATLVALALLAARPFGALAATTCDRHPTNSNTWKAGDAVGFASRVLNVDADGAPNSYRVDGNGLSYTCDGLVGIVNGRPVTPESDPHGWQSACRDAWAAATKSGDYSKVKIFGFETNESGRPIVQAQGDPLPGDAFVSATSMAVPGTPKNTQRHYVDATRIPYIVLPGAFAAAHGIALGDVAVVYRPRTKQVAFAVYADGGGLGEASVKLHQGIGNQPVVRISGIDRAKSRIEDKTVTVIFPGQHATASTDASAWMANIETIGGAAFTRWGGLARIQSCAE